MRQQARRKQHSVTYKGWTLTQVPWRSCGEWQYAKWLHDPTGKERMHAGYAKYCSHKELRLMIRQEVDVLFPALEEKIKEKQNDNH